MEEKEPVSFLITEDNSHTLFSEKFNATYHSTCGAVSESKHVFIQNGLKYIHEQLTHENISVFEVGFGTGLNAFLTYLYAKENDLKIHYYCLEAYPISLEQANKLNYTNEFLTGDKFVFNQMHLQQWSEVGEISDFFSFTKHLSLLEEFIPDCKFDIIYFDAFSPSEQPELWTEEVFKKMHALLNPDGVLVTYCAQGQMKRNMKSAGFKVKSLPGFGSKREMTMGLK